MNSTQWNLTGAIATQSMARGCLENSIANGTSWQIWMGDCQLYTCPSYEAAQAFIGKSKRYRIVKGGSK